MDINSNREGSLYFFIYLCAFVLVGLYLFIKCILCNTNLLYKQVAGQGVFSSPFRELREQ